MTNTITDQPRLPVRYLEDATPAQPTACQLTQQLAQNGTWWCKIATFGRDHLAGRWGMTALMVIGGIEIARRVIKH